MYKFIEASEVDVSDIVIIRQKSWESTYRGIYSDSMIDDFDFQLHSKKVLNIINDISKHIYKIIKGYKVIGYFSFGNPIYDCFINDGIHLYSLYIINEYQGIGLGRRAINFVERITKNEKKQFVYLTCNMHNKDAKRFYSYLGFELIMEQFGNGSKEEDQSFYKKFIDIKTIEN